MPQGPLRGTGYAARECTIRGDAGYGAQAHGQGDVMRGRVRQMLVVGLAITLLGVLLSRVSLGNPHVTFPGGEPVGLGGLLHLGLLLGQWAAIAIGSVLMVVAAASWAGALAAETITANAEGGDVHGQSPSRSRQLASAVAVVLALALISVAGLAVMDRDVSPSHPPVAREQHLPRCVVDGGPRSMAMDHPLVLAVCETVQRADGAGGGDSGVPRAGPVEPNTVWFDGAPSALACVDRAIGARQGPTGVIDISIVEAASTCDVLIEHYLPSGEMLVGTTEFSDDHTEPYLNPATGGMAPDGTLTDLITPE